MEPRGRLFFIVARAGLLAVLLLLLGCTDQQTAERVAVVESQQEAIDERLSKLEGRLSKLKASVSLMKANQAKAQAHKASPDPMVACSRAKVAAHDAWKVCLDSALKRARGCRGGGQDSNYPECGRMFKIKRAFNATAEGALKLRDAAHAVRTRPNNEDVARAKELSEIAFEACRDVAP